MIGDEANIEGEEHKEFLVVFPHTVVHPGAVVVHLLDTSEINKIR